MGIAIGIAILAIIVVFALKGVIKRIKTGGSCCGSGGAAFVQPKTLDGPAVMKVRAEIEGLHCENCKSKLERAVNAVDGMRGSVSLYNKELTVEATREIKAEELVGIVENAGYKVITTSRV